jgi:glycosyltransferase 2 family protein
VQQIWETIVTSVHRLASARPAYVAAALALYTVSLFIVAGRWQRFLRMLGASATVWHAALAGLGGIAVGNLIPSSRLGGEACRIALVRRSGHVTWQQATVAAVWDRLSEVPPIAVLVIMAVVAVRDLPSRWRTLGFAVGALVLVIAAVVGVRVLRGSSSGLAGWRDRLSLDRLRFSVFAAGVGFSCLLWLQDALRLTCASLAFGVALSPTKIATLCVLTILGSMVPAVAGIGPVEGSLVAGLVAFGVDLPTAAAITAVERLVSYGFSTSAGALVVALLGGRSLWNAIRYRTPIDSNDDTSGR